MKIYKILFLDIDGVLNSQEWFNQDHVQFYNNIDYLLNPDCIYRLNLLKDVDIVISSSLRREETTIPLLKQNGVNNILGITPFLKTREEEIQFVLDQLKPIKYAVLDDRNLKIDNLIRVDPLIGLTDLNIKECEKILN